MPLIAWPRLGGRKGRMVNLCGGTTDSVTGDYGTVGNLYDVWFDWPWDAWIKPQIDAAHALGANVVRFIFDATLRIGDASHHGNPTWRGTISDATMVARLDQLITYLDGLGMYFYATASEAWALQTAGVIGTDIQAHIERFAEIVSGYSNVVALDIANEHDACTELVTYRAAMIAAAKTAMSPVLPVSASIFSNTLTGTPWGATPASRATYQDLIDSGADFIDNHFYTRAFSPTDLAGLFALNVPIVIGEMGIDYNGNFASGAADGGSAARRAAYYDAIVTLSECPEIQATGVWAMVQMSDSPGNDWGLYGKTQDGSNVFIDPRTEMTTRFQLIPKAYATSGSGRFSSVFSGVVR